MTSTVQANNMYEIAQALGQLPDSAGDLAFIPTPFATFTIPGTSGRLINSLDCDGVSLAVPFFARIDTEGECVLASHPDLSVWGEGATVEEALDDMCREFVARFRFLCDQEARLGDQLTEELARFRAVLD